MTTTIQPFFTYNLNNINPLSILTKTKSSRLCQLYDNATESIEWLINHSMSIYILGNPNNNYGQPFMDRRETTDYVKPILKELKIPWIGTHGMFRKTFVAQVTQSSHKSPQMTMNYIHVIDTDLADELSKLDGLI